MTPATVPTQHDAVSFHFLGFKEDTLLLGKVLVRDGGMVLVIPGGYGPYHIVGKEHKHWYEGTNSDPKRCNEVDAKWTELGGTYVGLWIEEGDEFLFSFKLGSHKDKGAIVDV
jgi:hypothetical protein